MFQCVVVQLLLVALNAFLTMQENVLLSVNEPKFRELAEDSDSKAQRVMDIIAHPKRISATVRTCVSFFWVVYCVYGAIVFAPSFSLLLSGGNNLFMPPAVSFVISVLLLSGGFSFVMLLFGVMIPKQIAEAKADSLAAFFASSQIFFGTLSKPFVFIMALFEKAILGLFSIDPGNVTDDVTEQELRQLVSEGMLIDEKEKTYIDNIFEFNDKTALDICIHRKDVVSVSIEADMTDVIELATKAKFSRIPVYRDNIDNIVGILYLRDLFYHVLKDGNINIDVKLPDILRTPSFVPSTKTTDKLFEEMRKEKVHLVIVVDEYGGTAGIVTMEDLIEEIMGSILDEFDDEEAPEIEKTGDNTYRVIGSTELDIVSEYFDIKLPVDDYDTLSGFLIGQMGHIPEDGEKPTVVYENLVIKIESVRAKRIQLATITINEKGESGE